METIKYTEQISYSERPETQDTPETPKKKKLAKRRPKNPGYYKIVPELKRRFTRDRRSDVKDIRDIQLLLRQSGFQIQANR